MLFILLFWAFFIRFGVARSPDFCITPNGTPGTCIDYKKCPAIFTILNQHTILPNSTNFLINSFCGPSSDITKVCCEIISYEGQKKCTNPKLQNGICVGMHQCPDFANIVDQKIFPEHAIFAMNSACGPSKRAGIFSRNPEVCCVDPSIVGSPPRSGGNNSTEVNNSTRAFDNSTISDNNEANAVNKNNCENPLAMSGKCIGIKQCPSLLTIIQNKNLVVKKGSFIRDSVCGGKSGRHNNNVCCPSFNFLKHKNMALLPDKDTCGVISSPKVYGGTTADLGEFPWMVLLRYSRITVAGEIEDEDEEEAEEDIFSCGGSLINDRYVLTAAHCLSTLPELFNLTLKDIRLGEYDITKSSDCISVGPRSPPFCSDDVVDVPVEEIIIHQQYAVNKKKPWNDIALLRLARQIEYTEFIKPICLPSTPRLLLEDHVDHMLHIAGWGAVEKPKRGNILQKLQVPVLPNDRCIKLYKEMNLMTMKQICAGGEKGKDSCSGDSGGPLMAHSVDEEFSVNWYAVGVVSFGPVQCGQRGIPSVYTRVISYMDWIVENMKP